MKKVMLKLDLHDDKAKQKAMSKVSRISSTQKKETPNFEFFKCVDSISMMDNKSTVTGDIDPVIIVGKLRELFNTNIVSVGPPEKKKEEPNKEQPKKEEPKISEKEEETPPSPWV